MAKYTSSPLIIVRRRTPRPGALTYARRNRRVRACSAAVARIAHRHRADDQSQVHRTSDERPVRAPDYHTRSASGPKLISRPPGSGAPNFSPSLYRLCMRWPARAARQARPLVGPRRPSTGRPPPAARLTSNGGKAAWTATALDFTPRGDPTEPERGCGRARPRSRRPAGASPPSRPCTGRHERSANRCSSRLWAASKAHHDLAVRPSYHRLQRQSPPSALQASLWYLDWSTIRWVGAPT